MASGSTKPRNSYSDSAARMWFDTDLKKSSKLQHSSKAIRETVFPNQVKETGKHNDKLKGKSCSGKPYIGVPRELRQSTTSGYHQQEPHKATKTKRDDELVRYMSNLPGYLQQLDTGNKLQEKAFNVGVLDWSRLERWKGNQTFVPATDGNNSVPMTSRQLSSKMGIRPTTPFKDVPQEDFYYKRKQQTSVCSGRRSFSSSHNDGVSRGDKSLHENVLQCRQQIPSKSRLDREKSVPVAYKSFGNSDEILGDGKSKGLGRSSSCVSTHNLSNTKDDSVPRRNTEYPCACDDETIKKDGGNDRAFNQKFTLSARASSSKPNVLSNLKGKRDVLGLTRKTRDAFVETSTGLASGNQPLDNRNIVLLVPRKLPIVGSSEVKPRTSLNRNIKESYQNSCSGRFYNPEAHPPEHLSKVPYSCPLAGGDSYSESCQKRASASAMQSPDQSSESSQEFTCVQKTPVSLPADDMSKNSVEATKENATSRTSDQETADSASRKGRHPSPNRRFSFSLSRMTRSFSFKESSSVPQPSATYIPMKSGPVTSKAFACSEDSNKDKANLHGRARASPLRRILDPLLKPRGSTTLHSSHADPPSKSNSDFLDIAQSLSTASPQSEEHGKSIMQGHLQLVMKNGHPLFRLVVGNNRSILAATKTNITSPVKNDCGCSYTIYAIEEIKKKSGSWISHAGKEKSCGYAYNVVGQMKINTPSPVDFPQKPPIKQLKVKESVLFGVDLRQPDQTSPKFIPGRELAAAVIMAYDENERLDELEYWTEKTFPRSPSKNRLHCNLQGKDHYNSTTVILPGAVHSLPKKGGPSPLIERWKSGGLCDCGGWDVGCKLCVLSNDSHHFQSSKISDSSQTSDHLELFLQGEAQFHEPVFSLTLLEKGAYLVKFSSSISLLQAFFICVTAIGCQTSSSVAEVGNLLEEKIQRECSAENERDMKTHTSIPGQAASKYAPSPPFSPVSRV